MDESRGRRRILPLLLGAVLAGFTGQQLLGPVLPPLSRELGLGEVQLGLVITAAAVVFTLSSLFWGRVCDRWGQRPGPALTRSAPTRSAPTILGPPFPAGR